jgi:hypothetical protein
MTEQPNDQVATTATTTTPVVESPPAAPMPARQDPGDEARTHLHRLAAELVRAHNRRLVIEYLRLRRALR